jgi:hypothetical protein
MYTVYSARYGHTECMLGMVSLDRQVTAKIKGNIFLLPDTGPGVTLGWSLLPWAKKGLLSLEK